MPKYWLIFIFFSWTICLTAQNPHGDGLKMDCAACHTSDGWEIPIDSWNFEKDRELKISKVTGWALDWDTLKFNHFNTDFPLEGLHDGVDCRACHASLVFAPTSVECISCHTDVHQQTVGDDCARCHTEDNWLVDNITQLHQENGFPLLGMHATAACLDCHQSETRLQFGRIGNECINCHLDDFQATTNPNHTSAGYSTECVDCHQIEGFDWSSESFNHDFFPLTKGHDIADCAACHIDRNFTNTSTDCFACHQNDFSQTQNPNHQTASLSTSCVDCHTTDIGWTPAEFVGHDNIFPIYSGAHEGEWDQCIDCHNNPSDYSQITCTNCHVNPDTDEQHLMIPGYVFENTACLACHPVGNTDEIFDHDLTAFPLTGSHIDVDCIACHENGYTGTSTDCAACHQLDFDQTVNPNHKELNLSTDCVSCHTTEADWMPASFDIHNDYYALNGAHAAIANDCAACHNGDYTNTPSTCFGCHASDYNATTDPDHKASGFSTECQICHTETAWLPAGFDHDLTAFPLTGSHIDVDCIACHENGYTSTPTECAACHQLDFDQTVNPNHKELNLSTDCVSCHTTEADWMPASFDIHNDYYALNGAHAAIANDCAACHNGDYTNTPSTCFGCHASDYNATTDPDHKASGFSTECQICHTETAWLPAGFDHDLTAFPLTGSHIDVDCIACHENGYTSTPTECAACHQLDFDQTVNPNHKELNLSTDCVSCHTTEADWMPASFDIHNDYYALNGAHAAIANDCAACHNGDYTNTPRTCFGCHASDYNATTDPDHKASGFSTECQICHTETAWLPAGFDHDLTAFPLTGSHIDVDCIACHENGYTGTPTECAACHQLDFDQTVNPNHKELNLSTDCVSCHTTEADWMPASFDIHNDYYALNGAHAAIANDCAACHNGDYTNTPSTCFGCHASDYNATTDPDHKASGFSTECQICHTETAWLPAGFDHDLTAFPLKGAHTTTDCIDCHSTGYEGTPTDCAACHQGDFNQTTNPDHKASGFSTDCIICHFETAWIPATFDHDETAFPLTGAHQSVNCMECHSAGYTGTPTDCVACHQTDFDQSTNPNHQTLGLSSDCVSCHTTGPDWQPAQFDIHDQFYQLNGAHAAIKNNCNACHNGNYINTPTTCFGCHQSDYNTAGNPNHLNAGFPIDCESCHNENAWDPANFDHDAMYFPIYSGNHRNEWQQCSECHLNNDFNNFSCIDCHEHNDPNELRNDHDGVNGYRFVSTACYECHPNGESD